MDAKLIVRVILIREAGWVLPRHFHAFPKVHEGIFALHEERVPELSRTSRVARLLQVDTGLPVVGIAPLMDAVLLRATADEWVVTGFERVEQRLKLVDCAQTWVITPVALREAAHAA